MLDSYFKNYNPVIHLAENIWNLGSLLIKLNQIKAKKSNKNIPQSNYFFKPKCMMCTLQSRLALSCYC